MSEVHIIAMLYPKAAKLDRVSSNDLSSNSEFEADKSRDIPTNTLQVQRANEIDVRNCPQQRRLHFAVHDDGAIERGDADVYYG